MTSLSLRATPVILPRRSPPQCVQIYKSGSEFDDDSFYRCPGLPAVAALLPLFRTSYRVLSSPSWYRFLLADLPPPPPKNGLLLLRSSLLPSCAFLRDSL